MPKSKRDKKVDLTKVAKKPGRKNEYKEKIQKILPNYDYIYAVKFQNFRNNNVSHIRKELTDSTIIYSKNKLIKTVFGKNSENEAIENFHIFAQHLKGQVSLVLSNHSIDYLREFFNQYRSSEFSRCGSKAAQTVRVQAGLLHKLPHTMITVLRDLKLPVKLQKGIILLEGNYLICEKGKILTPEQCKILKIFDVQMSEFQVEILAYLDMKKKKVKDVHEKDACEMVTSLYPSILIKSQKLDDGEWYFIPENVEEKMDMEL